MEDELITVPEAAKVLNVPTWRIYELASQRAIPVVRLGKRQLRFSRLELRRFIQAGGTQFDKA